MIQRIQTLFLLEMVFLGISLFFVPVISISGVSADSQLSFGSATHADYSTTSGYMAATLLNILSTAVCMVTIFLFKKRELQVKLCYVIALIQLALIGMLALCPMVSFTEAFHETAIASASPIGYIILTVSLISSFLAARYVKKDIELLKSADRIR